MKIRFRELSKFGLWDKSQWAVMSKLAEAINQDVRIILNLVQDNARISESVKRDQDNTVKMLEVNLKSRISELDALKLKNVTLEQEILNGKTFFFALVFSLQHARIHNLIKLYNKKINQSSFFFFFYCKNRLFIDPLLQLCLK